MERDQTKTEIINMGTNNHTIAEIAQSDHDKSSFVARSLHNSQERSFVEDKPIVQNKMTFEEMLEYKL